MKWSFWKNWFIYIYIYIYIHTCLYSVTPLPWIKCLFILLARLAWKTWYNWVKIKVCNKISDNCIFQTGNKFKILGWRLNILQHNFFPTCEIWGLHCSDYEESRFPGYKNPVRTSQETHYVSATEPGRLRPCKIWGFHGGDYDECHLLRYNNPVHTSQETHYISATELNQLMLYKIWGFHGSDYEECLLGYKNPVHTSQEANYVSATETSQLMLCKIWDFHGGNYKECHLLGCYAIWLL
jgi:hypothetical protein